MDGKESENTIMILFCHFQGGGKRGKNGGLVKVCGIQNFVVVFFVVLVLKETRRKNIGRKEETVDETRSQSSPDNIGIRNTEGVVSSEDRSFLLGDRASDGKNQRPCSGYGCRGAL